MKRMIRFCVLAALAALVVSPIVKAGIVFNDRAVEHDSLQTKYDVFYLGSGDFDTSLIYNLYANPFLSFQARGYPLFGEAVDTTIDTTVVETDTTIDTTLTQTSHSDSGGVSIIVMLSTDGAHWFDHDSLEIGADTTWGNFKVVTLTDYAYMRYKLHTNADSDSLGVQCEIKQHCGGER